jgi:Putative  PD-(D/E)XK family member, (DUF4420)
MKIRRATVIEEEIKVQEEIRSLWETLEAQRITKLTQLRSQIPVGDRSVGVALDINGARHVLIPCAVGEDAEGLWRSSAVVLNRKNLIARDVAGTWLVLTCFRRELDEVFLRLAASVICDLPTNPLETYRSCLSTLETWRDLLGPAKFEALSQEQIVGLLGELLLLERLAEINPRRALEAWEGPLGGRHDFRYAGEVMEAKATLSRIGRFIRVHGPTQLEAPPGGTLHLSWIRLERTPGGSLSLPILVQRLWDRGLDRARLKVLLSRRAYDDSTQSPPADATYEMSEWRIWHIDESFPKVVPVSFVGGRIPNLVLDLQYTIDLSGPSPPPLQATEVEQVLTSMMGVT